MIKEYERELNELKEGKLISKEDLHEGDEIIYNGEHYFVTLTDTGTDFVWITDDKSDRYNRNAQGWTIKADWIDEVIGQPEEDELEESLKENYKKRYKKAPVMEDLDFADEAEIRKQLAKYSGQYLTITFKGSEDWKHISDLLEEYNDGDEEESDSALDELESTYRREYDLLKSLEVEEISEIADYTSYVIVTIKVEKDNLLHNFSDNYSDLINMPSIDTDTIKILELDKPTIQDTNTSSMTRDEMIDFIAEYVWDLSDTEYRKFKDKIALNFGIIWDNLKEDPEEGVYPSFTDNGLRIIIDKIIKAAKLKDESLKEDYQNIDSMSRRNLMDEIDDIYRWARQSHRTGITSIIEDPEVFPNEEGEEGYFKGVSTDKLKSILKTLRKMKYDSMSREELMDEIDDIYGWALHFKHRDITSIIEDPEIFSSTDVKDEEGYFKGVPTDKLRGVLKILRKMKDGGSKTEKDQEFLLSKEVDLHESVESKEIIKEDVNMSRKEMIDWIEDNWNDTIEHGKWLYNYLTELGFNVEDDSDEEEGFYANLTTSDLRKVINELSSNTKTSLKEQIAGIRKALGTLGKVSDVSLDYAGAEEATFDVNLKDGDTFRIQIYKM